MSSCARQDDGDDDDDDDSDDDENDLSLYQYDGCANDSDTESPADTAHTPGLARPPY